MIRLFVMPLIMLAAAPAFAAEPRTAAAVIAADKAWGEAEVAGNADFVDRLLLTGYVSIGPDGKTTTKEKIVAGPAAETNRPRRSSQPKWRRGRRLIRPGLKSSSMGTQPS